MMTKTFRTPLTAIAAVGVLVLTGPLSAFADQDKPQRDFSTSETTKVLMLGTGHPVPNPYTNGTSIAVIVNGTPYIVDAGEGIWRAMGEEMPSLPVPRWSDREPSKVSGFALKEFPWKQVFLTHLHSDHTIGLPSLILMPWSWRRTDPPHIYGPPGTEDLVSGILDAYRHDIAFRVYNHSQTNDTGWRAVAHEIFEEGLVFEDENVKVSAFKTYHGTAPFTYAYRFETPDKVIIISGDTGYVEDGYHDVDYPMGVLEAAKGVDVDILLHEVFGIDDRPEQPYDTTRSHIYHTSTKTLAKVANEVDPELLVMYHVQNYTDNPEQLTKELRKYGWEGDLLEARDRDIY